jgi:CRP-like cAMP-binding protein
MAWTTRGSARNPGLGEVALFGASTAQERRRLERLGTRLVVPAGRRLVTAGDLGRQVIIVLSGTATCSVGETDVAHFGPGDFFGEIATLDGGPRTASVVADTEMEVLVLTRCEFEAMIKASPEVAHRMLCSLAHRLRRTTSAVA